MTRFGALQSARFQLCVLLCFAFGPVSEDREFDSFVTFYLHSIEEELASGLSLYCISYLVSAQKNI